MSIYFYYFPIMSPLGRVWPFIWTNLDPLHQGILCVKFGWNWPSSSSDEEFYKLSIHYYYFPIISPLGRAWPLESPSPRDTLCQFEIGPVVLVKKINMWKVYGQMNVQTDDGWQLNRKAHLSFQLRWAKNLLTIESKPSLQTRP